MEQNTQNTALLVMDMQAAMLAALPDPKAIIKNVGEAINNARSLNIPVIYVAAGFRDGLPEVSERSAKTFASRKIQFAMLNMDEFMKIHIDLEPAAGEVTVVKRRVSAFSGSDMEVILRSFGINHIVLAGIATSGVYYPLYGKQPIRITRLRCYQIAAQTAMMKFTVC